MKHKVCDWLCGAIILASVVLGLTCRFVLLPLRAQTYVVSTWETVDLYAGRPAFWTCVGILGSLALFRFRIGPQLRKAFLWIGIVLIVLYGGALALFLARASVGILPLLSRYPFVFLVPGILIGTGLKKTM